MEIKPVQSASPARPQVVKPTEKGQTSSFGQILTKSVGEVTRLQDEASDSVRNLLLGKAENIHDVMLAMAKAELGFKLLLEVRNKALEAYREVQRMQG